MLTGPHAVQALHDQLVHASRGHDDASGLVCGQHDGQRALLGGTHGMDTCVVERDAEHVSVEKQQGVRLIEGLRLRVQDIDFSRFCRKFWCVDDLG